MPTPASALMTEGRKFRFQTEVLSIRCDDVTSTWLVKVRDIGTGTEETLKYSRVVLCTGGCSTTSIPLSFSPEAAAKAEFRGPVFRTTQFASEAEKLLVRVNPAEHIEDSGADFIITVGSGKSAQDISGHLANKSIKTTVVFEQMDAFLADVTSPRFLSIISGHYTLRSRLERFHHTTWLGGKITRAIWSALAIARWMLSRFPRIHLFGIHTLFWGIRTNDEGVGSPDGFHALANAGKTNFESPTRVETFGDDGHSVVLNNGKP
ncbi:hypothetical protein M422DRAFT_265026 [Sphaerobolus stellatus SS14]|uniref:Uncharacterized protein n=1 Tax=Sphaerobolus stellatus (strain SS14) TaxID=990650 RepID=A0A0C9TS96_SPHS4|nr:hypothetical protein M422DRAFT_265026 [Sphaerobolus stellatus SS14]